MNEPEQPRDWKRVWLGWAIMAGTLIISFLILWAFGAFELVPSK